jgi:spore coat protein CotH
LVLLANYRDVTDIMNTFVFEMGHDLGLPYTNHTRYVELFLNGDYKGIYQLTEQVQQNKNRVAVSDEHGILIALDVDDGPGENPYANDNFWSSVYRMPVCVKYPDDERWTVNTVDSVRNVFAELETAIKNKDYTQVQKLLDVPSFIKYLLIQEFVYNVELSAPRSIYMHKDGDGPWVMGPLWDFDAGYDFDWGQMTTGHTFFTDFTETVMGSNPLKRNGQYNYVPQFFTDLFACPEFVEAYKAQWAAVKDTIVTHAWNECMKYVEQMRASGAIDREFQRWPISGKHFETELSKMEKWLQNRKIHFSYLVAAIPTPK